MARILVCGDAMTDLYWRGDSSRLSPEAPVPVVSVTHIERREGAAANVANNIEAMGIQVERLFGSSKEKIQKIRLMARNQHVVRIDFDHQQSAIEPFNAFEDALQRCQIVVFIDYGKGSLDNIEILIDKACGKTILIDPKGHDYGKYRGATLIKPNREEMKELIGGWKTQDELDFKSRQFLLASGIESIMLTQAADGMTLYTRTETLHFKAEAPEIVDVSGAGETALAAYAVSLAKGFSSSHAAKYANKAAGIACSRFGTTIVMENEVFG